MLHRRWLVAPLAVVALLGLFVSLHGQTPDPAKPAPAPAAPAGAAQPTPPVATPPAPAGEAVPLAWKLEKGKSFYQELTTETKQNMKVMGMEVSQTQKQIFYLSWTVQDQDAATKNWVIKQKIEGVKLDITIAGNSINFDSTSPSPANNPLSDFFKALVNKEFTLTIGGPELKVVKPVEGRAEFLKALVQANQQMEPLLNRILSDEALKQMAEPTFSILPPNPVKKGDTWERKTDLNLGPIGSYTTTTKYTFDGKDDKNADLAKIKTETTLTYKAPAATEPSEGLPFKIKSADLKSKDGTGSVVFDLKNGRVSESTTKLNLEGNLSIEIGGTATPVDLKQEQTTTVKTSDSSFVKKPT